MTNQQTALDTYMQRLPMILDKIEALRQLADDHFGYDPEMAWSAHLKRCRRSQATIRRRAGPRRNGIKVPEW